MKISGGETDALLNNKCFLLLVPKAKYKSSRLQEPHRYVLMALAYAIEIIGSSFNNLPTTNSCSSQYFITSAGVQTQFDVVCWILIPTNSTRL